MQFMHIFITSKSGASGVQHLTCNGTEVDSP